MQEDNYNKHLSGSVRLDRIHDGFQDILEFGGILLDLVERAVVCWLGGIRGLNVGIGLIHLGKLCSALSLGLEHPEQQLKTKGRTNKGCFNPRR